MTKLCTAKANISFDEVVKITRLRRSAYKIRDVLCTAGYWQETDPDHFKRIGITNWRQRSINAPLVRYTKMAQLTLNILESIESSGGYKCNKDKRSYEVVCILRSVGLIVQDEERRYVFTEEAKDAQRQNALREELQMFSFQCSDSMPSFQSLLCSNSLLGRAF